MDLFGSREDDPLLQEDFPSASEEASTADDTADASPSTNEPAQQASTNPSPDKGRTLVYSQHEAENGSLSTLNRAFDQAWRLVQIQLRDDGHLVFDLKRSAESADRFGNVI